MTTNDEEKQAITVIGLGQMGLKIAELFLEQGFQMTVWNRTAEKATKLVENGAVLAPSVSQALAASPISIICVYDYSASKAIFAAADIPAQLAGKTIIQLTTGSPQEAREGGAWAAKHGASYLDGAIQVAPDQMAKPDTTILISGSEAAFRQNKPTLDILGGNITYLGEFIEAAATMDLATLSYVYGAYIGFIHGAHISETEGLDVAHYGRIVAQIAPGFGEFFAHEANMIQVGNYEITQSPLRISVEATGRILSASKEANINTEFPTFAADLLKRAEKAGYGDQEVTALIKVLRNK